MIACLIVLTAATGALSTTASAKTPAKAAAARPQASGKSLADFLPAALGDAKRQKEPSPSPPPSEAKPAESRDAHAAYLLPDPRFVNVNLMWVRDLAFEQAQFRVHVPGEQDEDAAARLSHEGVDVDGLFVQRTQYLPAPGGKSGAGNSEARALLADKIVVLVSVEKATAPNEPIEWLRKLDLAGLAAFAAGAQAPEDAPPPLALVIVHADPKPPKKDAPKDVKVRIVNQSKKPLTLFLNSGDPFGPGAFSFTMDDEADWMPIEVEHSHDGKLITRTLAPGKDYVVSLGPDVQFRGHVLKARYVTGEQHRGLCKACWLGTVTSSPFAVSGEKP